MGTCEQNEETFTQSISKNLLSVQFIEKESTVSGVLVAADAQLKAHAFCKKGTCEQNETTYTHIVSKKSFVFLIY